MRIGSIELSSPLFLSPLAGYTNLPMRLTVRELGGLGWATTDLVNARSLLERNHTALRLCATSPEDRPLAIQLFGAVPEEMRDAAVICQEMGVQSVDINMGCPVRKVVNVGGGSAMMTELKKTAALVRGMVEAVTIPVTAKMRLGWDEQNLTAPDLAAVLEDAGVAAVFVHGRTRAQGFSGRVNLDGIRAVVTAVKRIPVIGNGDVTTPEAARQMFDATGCAGVSIGRGAFYDPWIFRRTAHLLTTGHCCPSRTSPSACACYGGTLTATSSSTARPTAPNTFAASPRGMRGGSARPSPSSAISSASLPGPISSAPWPTTPRGGRVSATSTANCCRATPRTR